jgi:hypothetical protein
LLATRIESAKIELVDSPTLERTNLRPTKAPDEPIDPAAMIAAHVRLNGDRNLRAKLVRAAVSAPGLMQKGLDHDYKSNLY